MDKIEIKFAKLTEDAITPEYANEGDAGLDLFSIEDCDLLQGKSKMIGTGIKLQLPLGFEAQIRPRSGLALKHSITVLNSPGTIDAGYRGEIGVILMNHGDEIFRVEKGMRIAQMIIAPVYLISLEEVSNLDIGSRGENGFGSSGFKELK